MFAMRVGLLLFLLTSSLFSQENAPEVAAADLVAKADPVAKEEKKDDGYTINYNTISIIEYLRFASKICKVNFIYEEGDLNFTVTVVSDEPVTPDNVMATLVQVLRVHGLLLLEQDNNLVIHKSAEVRQIATLVMDGSVGGKSTIVTRIFRVKNAKPESVAAIIQPMISSSALLEVSSETRQLIVTDVNANVEKIAALIENLDSPHTLLVIKSYESLYNSPEYLIGLASQIMHPLALNNPFILVPQTLSNEVFIVSTPELADKAIEVFKTLDTTPKAKVGISKGKADDIFVYKVQNRSGENILKGLSDIASNLHATEPEDLDLMKTIESAKWIRETNSILFVGTKASIEKTKEFLSALDVTGTGDSLYEKSTFFIYKAQNRSAEEIRQALVEMAGNLEGAKGADHALIRTIQSSKVNAQTQTISFSGEEKTFPRVKELLATIDSNPSRSLQFGSSQFYIYKPTRMTGEDLMVSVQEMTAQLKSDKLSDPGLLSALGTMKWNRATNSLLFTGDAESLKKVQTIVTSMDSADSAALEETFFQYHPKYADEARTESYLKQVTQTLAKKGGSESLIEMLKSYKWIPDSQTFMFYGSRQDIDQLKSLLASFDTPDSGFSGKPGYFIYKVQNTTGDVIEEDLDAIAKNLKASGVKDTGVVDVIDKMRYVKQTNSLLLSGDPKAIEAVKQLIAEHDYARSDEDIPSSNFFMYKPLNAPADSIESSLREIGDNLKKAGLADPSLLKTLDSIKYVQSTNTLIFTGPPETLQKIQTMVKEIDIPPNAHKPIQHLGKTTFLLYKLKNAGGPQIVDSLKNMTAELKKSGSGEKGLLSALKSMKYIRETNSLFFTGDEESLKKVEGLVEQFDVTSLAAKPTSPQGALGGPSNFYVYKPQSLPGPELESVLHNFAENLSSSGLSDPDLFKTINSMRWSDQTQTLVFTGPQKTLDQIRDLLKQFDIPANLQGKLGLQQDSIQAIDNTSFLVYKLQFHKGEEIQNALRQIAKDLTLSNAPVNHSLLNSINSIQWLEVTNSLLCSGDQDTLTRLRELIKNLDIPLKQVFIEMLVIETTMTNALNFGLEWGGNYKYRDKFSGSMNNTVPFQGASPDTFMQNFSQLTPPTAPTPNLIPVSSGFDLGVIGEVIKHNGQTYLTLGSLLTALQQDDETSVIMTPKILTQDGRTSTIFDGRNIPFVGSFVQNNGSNVVNTSNIEYRDIGFKLVVTPVLGNSDIVTLDIDLDRSQTLADLNGNTINFSSSSAQGITTTKTSMQTTVHVPNNNFLVLSGMVNNSSVKSKAGIPCLGGLPLIGAAFSKNGDTLVNTNIVIFIRPHIINSIDEMRTLTKREEDYFRDQAASPYLEKSFDEGMELIKTIDDE